MPHGDSAVVLALNPGSSSLKCAVRTGRDEAPVLAVSVDRIGSPEGSISISAEAPRPFDGDTAAALEVVAQVMERRGLSPRAVSHRVVHGGPAHAAPEVFDDTVLSDLRQVVPLASLHLPESLRVIRSARLAWPDAVHVACYDTYFHRDLPETSRRLPIGDDLVALGLRRYGFHGLSLESVVLHHPALGDAVVAHLGSGCSVTAVAADGTPRHTTMSLTPTAGMMSATRSGDLDPEIPLQLIEQHGYTPAAVREALARQAGLTGISGGRRDMRDLEGAADAAAALARAVFVQQAAMAIASCATTLDAWQSLVFTGGIGEHDESVRTAICRRLRLDGIDVLTVAADEESILDRHARSFL